MDNIVDYLENEYVLSMENLSSSNEVVEAIESKEVLTALETVLNKSESSKGVLTVLLTSIVYKHFNNDQDIRYHQASLPNGYSGRSFDTKYITPFLKRKKFPAMAESGWLTRSLEHNSPYDKNYNGKIHPKEVKDAFLVLMDEIQKNNINDKIIQFIFQYLILQRNKNEIQLARPRLSINDLIHNLDLHFSGKYSSEGASRLPVLAIYAIYQCLTSELRRFNGKHLLPLESHTSADSQSGRIGDINIIDEKGREFESVEIKHGIEITKQLVLNVYDKFQVTPVNRYYILSTAGLKEDEKEQIKEEVIRIKNIHGCQLIVNGIIETLKYYLRLINDTYDFIDNYVNLLELDNAIKYEHKIKWNEIVNGL